MILIILECAPQLENSAAILALQGQVYELIYLELNRLLSKYDKLKVVLC
jgi:hypothetical protein